MNHQESHREFELSIEREKNSLHEVDIVLEKYLRNNKNGNHLMPFSSLNIDDCGESRTINLYFSGGSELDENRLTWHFKTKYYLPMSVYREIKEIEGVIMTEIKKPGQKYSFYT